MSYHTGSVPDTPRKPDWRDTAACRNHNPERWFPHTTNTTAIQAAKTVCFGCPAMLWCAQHALRRREDSGVWGGLSEGQRTTILKRYRAHQLDDLDTVRAAVHRALRDELNPEDNLRDVWKQRTYPLPGGHLGWRGDSASFTFRGVVWTPKQLAFFLDRGHKSVGIVRRTPECPVVECVHPLHIADNKERHQAAQARKQAAESQPPKQNLAPCGSRSAYQRHVRNREPIDDACRAANTAARYERDTVTEDAA